MRRYLENNRKGLDKASLKAYYSNKSIILQKVKTPILQYDNTVLFQSQEFCSEKFLKNRTNTDQDNFRFGRLEGGHNYKTGKLASLYIIKIKNKEKLQNDKSKEPA